MLKKILDLHLRLAKGKIIFPLIFLYLVVIVFIVPWIYPKFQTLDTTSSYTPARAYELISSYGEQGRQYYAVIELTLDLVYPFISALMFSLMIIYTFKKAFPGTGWVLYLCLAPYAVMLADYLENACVVTMLLGYPRKFILVAQASNIFTATKDLLAPLQLLFFIGLAGWFIRSLNARRREIQ